MGGENMKKNTGVYICHCGTNIGGTVDCNSLAAYAKTLPQVKVAREYAYMCSDPGQELIAGDIRELGLERVVVAACSPRLHEATFRELMQSVGLNKYLMEMANIREQCSWVHKEPASATAKAKQLLSSAVQRVYLHRELKSRSVPINPAVLVIGGGIAGIQASLIISRAGYQVYLVEKESSIGGHMAQLDKTFPTLDCSACILTPKMVELSRQEKVKLMTYAEVESIEGYVGNYNVRVKQHPRYVDTKICTGCGSCMEACAARKIPSEFDEGTGMRSAAFIPFPQAVPLKSRIDSENCLVFTQGKCYEKCEEVYGPSIRKRFLRKAQQQRKERPKCVEACQAGAIDFEQKEKHIDFDVGAIILATGYDLFEAEKMPQLGYGRYDNVITGLQFERMVNATGPSGGKILKSNGEEPRSIAFLHCVGSRDENHNFYCSRVCCMYNMKHAYQAREKTDARVYEFYIDLMAYGKGYQEFYQRVREKDVIFTRGKCAEVMGSGDKLKVFAEDTLMGRPLEIDVDMVVLGVGIVPRSEAGAMASLTGISRGADGFFAEAHPKLRPVETHCNGIYVTGCCQGPKDIPDTVVQASSGAAEALALISAGEIEVETVTPVVDDHKCRGCGFCVEICLFKAVLLNEETGKAEVNEVLCKGCGACVAACLSAAADQQHFTDDIILAQIKGIL